MPLICQNPRRLGADLVVPCGICFACRELVRDVLALPIPPPLDAVAAAAALGLEFESEVEAPLAPLLPTVKGGDSDV